MYVPAFLGDDYPLVKLKRSRRRHYSAKYHWRHREHGLKRCLEPDYDHYRQPSATVLAFGVAYEKRPSKDLF